jgi:hypothetical protein
MNDFEFQEPWDKYEGDGKFLLEELRKELSRLHILYGKKAKVIATNCDDILLQFQDLDFQYAVVYLTWRGSTEWQMPIFPHTETFKNWEELEEKRLLLDYEEFK